MTCNSHFYGVAGTCLYCGAKRPDHDLIAARLQTRFADLLLEKAAELESENLLLLCNRVSASLPVRWEYGGLSEAYKAAFAEVVGDGSREQEFKARIFWGYYSLDRSEEALFAFVRESVALALETGVWSHLRPLAEKVRAGCLIAGVDEDAFAWACQTVRAPGGHDTYDVWRRLIFIPKAETQSA